MPGKLVAPAARDIRVYGQHVSYARSEGQAVKGYSVSLPDGQPKLIATLGEVGATEGTWFLAPEANISVAYRHGLQTMEVLVGGLGEALNEPAFTVDAQNYQEISGAYFGGFVPTAVSGDGQRVAFMTLAPNDYNACDDPDTENSAQCTGPGQKCGRFERCTALEVTLHFMDVPNLANLGTDCVVQGACGSLHQCDEGSPISEDLPKCVPNRVAMGLPVNPFQGMPPKSGCDLTSGRTDRQYTDLRGPLSFGPDGKLYAVAGRRCDDFNIERTVIVSVDPATGALSEVWGNRGENFDEARCYSEADRSVDVTNCVVHIKSARLSPAGNEIVFLGTNPNIVDVGLATSKHDLWIVRRDGTRHRWVGNHREIEVVKDFNVHAER